MNQSGEMFFEKLLSLNKDLVLLTLLYIIVNSILFWKLGVSVDDDTRGYLLYAQEIKERGIFYKPHLFWYISYPIFILIMTSIHDSLSTVVLGQLFFSYLALISLYFSALRLFKNTLSGMVVGVLFLGFFMISFWNFWIYCESLLISLNCLSFYFLIKWYSGEGNTKNYLVGLLVIIAAFFTKPTGIALLGGILIGLGIHFWRKEAFQKVRWFGIPFISIIFIILLNKMLSTYGFVEAYQMGEIVYNIHKLAHMEYAKWLILNPPHDLYIPDSKFPTLIQFVFIIFGNPLYSLQLFLTKGFFYSLYIRPYYSTLHNILALFLLVPAYLAFFKEMAIGKISSLIKSTTIGFVTISMLSPTLLTIDWNSRFLVAVLPIIFLISSERLGLNLVKFKKLVLNFSK